MYRRLVPGRSRLTTSFPGFFPSCRRHLLRVGKALGTRLLGSVKPRPYYEPWEARPLLSRVTVEQRLTRYFLILTKEARKMCARGQRGRRKLPSTISRAPAFLIRETTGDETGHNGEREIAKELDCTYNRCSYQRDDSWENTGNSSTCFESLPSQGVYLREGLVTDSEKKKFKLMATYFLRRC